jgi:heterodisulfide reductase subunit D
MTKESQQVFQDVVNRAKAYYCLDCGKCTSVCPISLLNEGYSPRLTVQKALLGNPEVLLKDELLWSCLTCGRCDEICESNVHYTEFIKDLRIEAYKIGREGVYAHEGTLQSIMRMMTSPKLKQNRLNWVSKDLKISDEGEVLYFVGCLPYFDAFFTDLKLNTLDIAKSTIKILNRLGIEPVLMPNERCCGHDLLWTGDVENFKRLAQLNIEEIKRTGVKKIVFSCPEGYYMFKKEYPRYVGALNLDIIHISELIVEKLPEMEKREGQKATYQDPCRLGRLSGIYEQPRQIINAIGIDLYEMPKSGKSAICCGTSGWMNCGTYSKQIQVARLREARDAGTDLLITSCPKCMIHFKCAQAAENIDKKALINIQDLTTLVAKNLIERR